MTKESLDTVDSIMRAAAKNIAVTARNLTVDSDKKTISSREIQTVCRLVLPADIAKHATSDGTQAICRYATHAESASKGTDKIRVMREKKAGLLFSVSQAEHYLRRHGCNVGEGAPVYMAAVLEFLCSDLLDLAGATTREGKRSRIRVREIMLAVEGDEELRTLFNTWNIRMVGAGVLPNIDERICESHKAKSAKKVKRSPDPERKRKFRPGTTALHQIKKLQKTNDTLLCKTHVNKLLNETIKSTAVDTAMITSGARILIQQLVEDDVVRVFREANERALCAGRTTVQVKDFRCGTKDYPIADEMTEGPISRLGKRAGIYRMSTDVWKFVRGFIAFRIVEYIRVGVIVMEHQARAVLTVKHICDGMDLQYGIHVAVIPRKIRRTKKAGDSASVTTSVKGDEEEAELEHDDLPAEEDEEIPEESDHESEPVAPPPKKNARSRVTATK